MKPFGTSSFLLYEAEHLLEQTSHVPRPLILSSGPENPFRHPPSQAGNVGNDAAPRQHHVLSQICMVANRWQILGI